MSYQKVSEIELKQFAIRLNEVCNDMGMPEKFTGRQVELAKVMTELTKENISSKAVRKWLEGVGFPSTDKIILIAKWANVSAEWFLTGQGPKILLQFLPLDPQISHVIKVMQSLDKDQNDQFVKIINALAPGKSLSMSDDLKALDELNAKEDAMRNTLNEERPRRRL